MIIMVCLDENDGMTFAGRRQSRDRQVIKDIAKQTAGKRLFIDEFSKKLFLESGIRFEKIDGFFLDKAEKGDYCFLENYDASGYEEKIEEIIVYRWNRAYPSDLKFTLLTENPDFKCRDSEDFDGYSHKTITRQVYRK